MLCSSHVAYKVDVYLLPEQLDENGGTLHRVVLTVFAQEHRER